MIYFIIIVLIIIIGTWIYCLNAQAPIINNLKYKVFRKKQKLEKRKISNKIIKEDFEFLKKEFYVRKIKVKKEKMEIPISVKQRVIYSKFEDKEVLKLLKVIYNYIGLTGKLIFNVKYYTSKDQVEHAGDYFYRKNEIILHVTPESTFETVLATLIHECTHSFLINNGIWKGNIDENEILTDLCTIYLGLGKEMYVGYKLQRKALYLTQGMSIYKTNKINKVGYINPGDIKYAMKIRKKYIKN